MNDLGLRFSHYNIDLFFSGSLKAMSNEQLFSQACGLTDNIEITLRFYFQTA